MADKPKPTQKPYVIPRPAGAKSSNTVVGPGDYSLGGKALPGELPISVVHMTPAAPTTPIPPRQVSGAPVTSGPAPAPTGDKVPAARPNEQAPATYPKGPSAPVSPIARPTPPVSPAPSGPARPVNPGKPYTAAYRPSMGDHGANAFGDEAGPGKWAPPFKRGRRGGDIPA